MSGPTPAGLLVVADEAARVGAATALDRFGRLGDLHVEEKAASDDLVSEADRETEQAVLAVLRDRRPDDAVLGEESGASAGRSGLRWVVDPIDGTTSFLYGRADWAVSVAVVDEADRVLAGVVVEPVVGRTTAASAGNGVRSDGHAVGCSHQDDLSRALVELNVGRGEQRRLMAPLLAELVPLVRDVRRGGSAAAALAQVATGRADAAWLPGLKIWDCAAGVLLAAEAGATVGDADGATHGRVPASGDVLAAAPALWAPLRGLVAHLYRDGTRTEEDLRPAVRA